MRPEMRRIGGSTFLQDAVDFARRRPEVVVGGLAVAGFLVARYVRGSGRGSTWSGQAAGRIGGRSSTEGEALADGSIGESGEATGQGSVGERHADWGPEPSFQPETGSLSGRPGQTPRGARSYNPDDRDRDRPTELSPDDLGL